MRATHFFLSGPPAADSIQNFSNLIPGEGEGDACFSSRFKARLNHNGHFGMQ